MKNFIIYLENRLKHELPGISSHLKMAPKIMERSFRALEPSSNARRSAVLIILTNAENPEILFTLRSSNLRKHRGQISFPGGMIEEGETAQDAALRETFEEIGIERDKIKIIGRLSPLFVPPSNNLIHPFIGIIEKMPDLIISEDEVEECFTIKISYFADPINVFSKKEILEGYEVDMPYWEVEKKSKLWGATSMILHEFIDIYNEWMLESDK
jgi:8-oxo-dGTP pyrophosphatase MutT (NUDIX family)